MAIRISNSMQNRLLMLWHGAFSGGFIIAYLSEHFYAMHVFAGYLLLGIIAVRLLVGLVVAPRSPLTLYNPMAVSRLWIDNFSAGRKARNPVFSWLAAAMLAVVALAALSGWMADLMPALKGIHEVVAGSTLFVIFSHIGFVMFRRLRKAWPKLHMPNVIKGVRQS